MRAASEHPPPAGAPPPGPARRARFASLPPALLALSFALAPRPAAADPAAAEALFQEGRRLLLRGQIDEACEQLGESQRLDPSSGTLINLADCHERQGKIATAWAEFLAASRLAVIQKNATRSQEAGRRAALLEPRLSYLTVRVAAPPPGLKVQRGAQPMQGVQFGARLPVDPGEHTITAEAPGYATFQATVAVKPDGDDVHVWVPPLWGGSGGLSAPALGPERAGGRAKAAPEASPPARRRLGYAAAGLGALGVGVGAFFGVRALATNRRAEDACPTHDSCPPEALDERSRADTQAWASNIAVGAGLAGLALGGYLLFLDSPATAPAAGRSARGRLGLSAGLGGLGLVGRF
ncbi:MAG TPA: hypothetical protein VFS43_15150 [Polyangiaceae bacterium]|nr:hypothetical protein [Polyangiaceae bacterium]